jgi:ribonuclease R
VVSVAGFGLFVELDDVYVEGLVHVSSLRNDYYHYDAARQALIGERTHQRFTIGDRVRVQVADVDLDERKIDFLYLGRDEQAIEKTPTSTEDDSEWTDARLREKRMNAIRKALERDGGHSEKNRADESRRRDSAHRSKSAGEKTKVRSDKVDKKASKSKSSAKKRRK